MPHISLSRPPAWNALGESWRGLEARARASFFCSWSWVGCAAARRFTDPLLLEAKFDGRTVALGLFNRRRRGPFSAGLWLNESGDPALDGVYVEHNGLLVEHGLEGRVLPAALGWLARQGERVVLSGVDEGHLEAVRATGALLYRRNHPSSSPWVALDEVRACPSGHLGLLSANTRHQLRRSLRRYGEAGALSVTRAETQEEAAAYLTALGALHQRTWTRRGKPGAFASPAFVSFHMELLGVAWPRGEIDLLCVRAGERPIGYLYNFRWQGRVGNYQSGFDYDAATQHQKPGLTCHHLAIGLYADEGMEAYDFLAGDHRYKSSLSNRAATLHWIEMMPRGSLTGLFHRLMGAVGGR